MFIIIMSPGFETCFAPAWQAWMHNTLSNHDFWAIVILKQGERSYIYIYHVWFTVPRRVVVCCVVLYPFALHLRKGFIKGLGKRGGDHGALGLVGADSCLGLCAARVAKECSLRIR